MTPRLYVRDSLMRRIAEVDDAPSLDLLLRFNDVGTWRLMLNVDSPAAAMIDELAGIVLVDDAGTTIFSGPATKFDRAWTVDSDRLVVSGLSDDVWLTRRLCYPEAPATTTSSNAYDVRVGVASTVMAGYVDDNAGPGAISYRQVSGLVIGTDLGVGETVTGRARWQTLLELLQGLALSGGDLGFRVIAVGSSLEFQVYEPVDVSRVVVFSGELGNVRQVDASEEAPDANVAVVADSGDDIGRAVATVADADSITRWGRIETFVDARDTNDSDELNQQGQEALDKSAESSSISLIPLGVYGFGVDYGLGARVTAVVDGVRFPEIVREVAIKIDPDGMVVTPTVATPGERDPNVPRIYERMRALERRLLALERRK